MRNRSSRTAYPSFRRWCGAGAVLAGVLFVVWGYVDRPDVPEGLRIVVNILSSVVPMLFFVVVLGPAVSCTNRRRPLKSTGPVLCLVGSTWGVVGSIANLHPLYAYLAGISGWPRYLFDWLLLLQIGLALTGIATVSTRSLRWLGILLLSIGVFGWGYTFTDTGVILEARAVHVGCGLLFSLGWVVLGMRCWVAGASSSDNEATRHPTRT
jgi:hypothetical protein